MNDMTAGADTPAADGVAPDALVDNAPEATPGQQSEAANTETQADAGSAATGDDAAANPKKKNWAHERIDELTRQRREAERTAEYWKAKAERPVNLDALDYDDGIAERVSQKSRREQAEVASDTAARLAFETFNHRETLARDRFKDYDAVTRSQEVMITPQMLEVITDSEHGPDIAYHLGKNPAEAARIAALPPVRLARELGRIEAQVSAPRALPKQPPAPITPVSGIAAGGTKAPEAMSMNEYAAWRKGNP